MAIHFTGNGPYSCSMICKQEEKKIEEKMKESKKEQQLRG